LEKATTESSEKVTSEIECVDRSAALNSFEKSMLEFESSSI